MLFILFHLGSDRYALDSAKVAEVLPLVRIKAIPHAELGVAGVFNYRGDPVPVIDLSALAFGRPAATRLSTRLILVHYAVATGASRLLGLIAEKATETLRRDPADWIASGVTSDAAPYLGPVASDERGLIQWIEPATLLPVSLQDTLFKQAAESV